MKGKNRNLMFLVLYLSAITISLSQMKIPPIMGPVSEALNVSISQASWLMSIFTVAGIVLAIPGAAIMNKVGPKKLLMYLMVAVVVGNLIGAFTGSFPLMLISRAIEGIAFAMVIMVGIVMVNTWYTGKIAGTMVGVFNTFGAIGPFLAMNIALPVVSKFGLKSVWLLIAALGALCFVLVGSVIEMPETEEEGGAGAEVSLSEAIMNKEVWLIAFIQGCVAFVLFAFITTYPQIFSDFYELDPVKSNFYASLNGLFGIPFCIIGGAIVDKTGKPLLLSLISFIVLIGVGFTTTLLGPSTFVLHLLLSAIFPGFIITSMFIVAPSIAKRPAYIGHTVAFVNLIYYVAVFASTPIVLGAAESSGWAAAKNIMTAVAAVGAVLTVVAMNIMKEKSQPGSKVK